MTLYIILFASILMSLTLFIIILLCGREINYYKDYIACLTIELATAEDKAKRLKEFYSKEIDYINLKKRKGKDE